MNIESIFNEWNVDSHIDITMLDQESIKIPKLHSKYFRYLSTERLLLIKYQSELKKLNVEKLEYYSCTMDQETLKEKGLVPWNKMMIKSDQQAYIDGDSDIIDLSLKIGYQKEKVNLLESILAILKSREFQIKNANDFRKLQEGF